VLVTHQLQYLHDAEHIVIMNAGQVKAQGTYEFIKSRENEFSAFYDFEKSIATTVDSSSNDGDEENNDSEVSNSI
jgi:ABC-type transport system involved in cytochrome bd biosynthesis fused ATPase/permease subunit